MSPSRRSGPPPQTACEWVGGRLLSPFYITDTDPPYRPEMILWVEVPGEVPVVAEILDPDPRPPSLAQALVQGFANPVAGPPRRPRRVRVADPADAAEVRAAVGPAIEVVVGPTPELAAVVNAMAEAIGGEELDASYFEEGAIPPEVVADLFDAAQDLYDAAPWEHASDEQTIRLDIPALGVEGACVSIIGALEEHRGLVIFPSDTAFEAFIAAAEGFRLGEEPADLATSMLWLTLEPADTLPASMRREALSHGWPVAAPDAYPVVDHRDRDGAPRPRTERDVRIATACARAVTAFDAGHGHVFAAEEFTPVSVTFTAETGVAVRVTAPYAAIDLIDADPDWAAPDDEAPPPPDAPALIHAEDERLVDRMLRFASARFGRGWLHQAARPFTDPEACVQLLIPWAAYHPPIDGQPVVDWFLAERGRRLSPEQRAWLAAQRTAWLGVWEVREVVPGRSLRVRDLLTGADRQVVEVSGSRTLVLRDAVLGRVVDHDGLSVFAGIHPRPLAPAEAADLVRAVRGRVRRRREIPVERLREPAVERYLIRRWEAAVASMDERRSAPPTIHNTDGDELLLTTDDFTFEPAARGDVAATLAAVADLEETTDEEDVAVYTWVRPDEGTSMLPGPTVLGWVRLTAERLTLETNSLARADRLRARLETACGDLIAHRAREHVSPAALAEEADLIDEPEEPPPPEAEAAVGEWLEGFAAWWVDHPVPALGDVTPRAAARTRAGREALEVLLRCMENDAARWSHGSGPDVARIRAELGMED